MSIDNQPSFREADDDEVLDNEVQAIKEQARESFYRDQRSPIVKGKFAPQAPLTEHNLQAFSGGFTLGA